MPAAATDADEQPRHAPATAPGGRGRRGRPPRPRLAVGPLRWRRDLGDLLLVGRGAGRLVRELHRREGDVHDVVLLGERLDDDPEVLEVVLEHALLAARRG